jgi:hypothetical protein
MSEVSCKTWPWFVHRAREDASLSHRPVEKREGKSREEERGECVGKRSLRRG